MAAVSSIVIPVTFAFSIDKQFESILIIPIFIH